MQTQTGQSGQSVLYFIITTQSVALAGRPVLSGSSPTISLFLLFIKGIDAYDWVDFFVLIQVCY